MHNSTVSFDGHVVSLHATHFHEIASSKNPDLHLRGGSLFNLYDAGTFGSFFEASTFGSEVPA